MLALAMVLAGAGCGSRSTDARARPVLPASAARFNTLRYGNVGNAYPSADYGVVDVDLRHVLLYNADSHAGKHGGLGPCSNLDYVAYIHCLNPAAKVLLYQDTFTAVQNNLADAGLSLPPNEDATGCTTYATDAKHPDWFLHDNQGGELVNWVFANTKSTNIRYLMDAGNSGYQQACANQIISTVRRYGFDGVFLDDNGWWGFYTWYDARTGQIAWASSRPQNGYSVPSYSDNCRAVNPCSWMKAIVAFNNRVAPRIHAAKARSGSRLLVFGNTGYAQPGGDYRAVIGPLDGFMEESWTDGGQGLAQQTAFWQPKATTAAWGAANGKYEMFHSWNTTESGNTLGLAAALLFARGKASYSTANAGYSGSDTWYPEYGTAERLGEPTGPYTTSAPFTDCTTTPHVYYERRFRYGLVVVNPCASTISGVSLGGTYSGSGNEPRNVTTLTLAPTTGYILTRNGAPSAAPARLPAVSLSAAAHTLNRGRATTLRWSGRGATTCAAPWTRSRSAGGSQRVTPTTSTIYTITCNARTGSGAVGSVLVTVRGTPAPSPRVTVTARPAIVALDYGSIISWTSRNATACTAKWSSSTGVSGSNGVFSLTTRQYLVTCTGGGRTATGAATVTVTQSPPAIVIGGRAQRPVDVIGTIRLVVDGSGASRIVYRFDGRRLASPIVHTDFYPGGHHTVEADITRAGGGLIIKRRTLNVLSP